MVGRKSIVTSHKAHLSCAGESSTAVSLPRQRGEQSVNGVGVGDSADKGDSSISLIDLHTKIVPLLAAYSFALSTLPLGEHKADAGAIFRMWVMF